MSYRDGYDARKWFAHTAKRRPRRSWVRWAMAGGLAMMAAMPPAADEVEEDSL